MSNDHGNTEDDVCGILNWYGFNCDEEYHVHNGFIDCVAYRNGSSKPFMGIEVHLQGQLDTDLKKLLSAPFLTNKVIITMDRSLIDRMSKSMSDIFWCPLPGEDDHTFENYVRNLSGAAKRNSYWYQSKRIVENIQTGNGMVQKFEELLSENGLNVDLAEEIIYRFAAAGQAGFLGSKSYTETNEYKFLKSLGIAQGLEIYWFSMEWGDKARYSYESAEVSNITRTRKMNGEPLAYEENRELINLIMSKYVENIMNSLGGKINGYSKIFSESALIGTAGYFRPYKNNFIPANGLTNWTPPVEIARLRALVANSFISQKIWEFGKELAKINLGVKVSDDLILVPYKLISETFRFSGIANEKEDEIDEYLAWWVLYAGGKREENIEQQCNFLGIPFEDVVKCVDETFSKGLTSRYIRDTDTSRMGQFMNSHGGHNIGGLSNIAVFRPEEFEAYCFKEISESLTNIFGQI